MHSQSTVFKATKPEQISYALQGAVFQVLTVKLAPGCGIYAQAGAMSWLSDDVEMQTKVGGSGLFDGMKKAAQRSWSGEGLTMVYFRTEQSGGKGIVAFTA